MYLQESIAKSELGSSHSCNSHGKNVPATAAVLCRRLIRPRRVRGPRHAAASRGEKVKEEACMQGRKDGRRINIQPSFLPGRKVGMKRALPSLMSNPRPVVSSFWFGQDRQAWPAGVGRTGPRVSHITQRPLIGGHAGR